VLRTTTDVTRTATIASLYQAGEPIYELFDKVCLVYDGRMVYFGPASQAREYFVEMGFQPAPRQTTADFLVTGMSSYARVKSVRPVLYVLTSAVVTDPSARSLRSGFENQAPRTAVEFASHFMRSRHGVANREDMQAYRELYVGNKERKQAYMESAEAERPPWGGKSSPYTVSVPVQLRALVARRAQILRATLVLEAANLL